MISEVRDWRTRRRTRSNPDGAPVLDLVTLVSPDDLAAFTGYREPANARQLLKLAQELGFLHAPEEGRLTVRFRRGDGRQVRVHCFVGGEEDVRRRLRDARRDPAVHKPAAPKSGRREERPEGGRLLPIVYW